jgi:hypothetical protein
MTSRERWEDFKQRLPSSPIVIPTSLLFLLNLTPLVFVVPSLKRWLFVMLSRSRVFGLSGYPGSERRPFGLRI